MDSALLASQKRNVYSTNPSLIAPLSKQISALELLTSGSCGAEEMNSQAWSLPLFRGF
jgi:hypothetical protein